MRILQKRSLKRLLPLVAAGILLMMLSGCLPGNARYGAMGTPAGFFSGIWHGWLAPLSLILGFFNDNIHIYESHNTGWWYDLGYYMAVISGFGGISLARRNRKH